MTTERIDIVVREDGSRVVRRNLEDIGAGAGRAETTVEKLKRSLSGMGGLIASMGIGLGIREMIQYTDTWANLEGRLKLVTTTTSQLHRVQSDLFSLAQRTRTGYEGTADLYARIARSTENLNASDRQRLTVTENINKALIISGSSATSAEAALVQLGQGFAGGVLRGQELNSVMEQTPRLAQAIAEGMGKTIGQLRALGAEGLLTSEQVFSALENQSVALQAEFGKMPVTIGQSFTMLNNEVMKFIGTANQANGNAKLLSEAILLAARNIDVIVASLLGLVSMKIADFFIGATVAIYSKVNAILAHSSALQMDRVFEIASAEARLASVGATIAQITATQGAIVMSRNEAVARLQQSNANIQSARTAIAAATAAGAQSFALAILRTATAELAVAEAARVAALAALATLGQQQTRVTAQLTAATAAQTLAQAGLTAAQTAGAGAAGLAARALGFLGGPIGIITTVLGLGVAAWALWGNKATAVETQVAETLESKTADIITNLDKQIAKLNERNRLAKLDPGLAKAEDPVSVGKQDLMKQINEIASNKDLNSVAKTDLLSKLGGLYNELTIKSDAAATAKREFDKTLQGDKLKDFMKEFSNAGEQRAAEIKKWKGLLGDLYSPEVEKRINEAIPDKPVDKKPENLAYRAQIQALEMKQKLEREILAGGMADAESLRQQGLMSETAYVYKKRDLKLSELAMVKELTQKELETSNGPDRIAQRQKFLGELTVIEQARKNIIKGTENEIAEILSGSAQKERDNDNKQLASINEQAQAARERVQLYEMLPGAITAVAIADQQASLAALEAMGADKGKTDAIRQRILALQELQGWQQKGSANDLLVADTKAIGQEWQNLGNTIANSMTSAFGKVGKSVSSMVTVFSDFKRAQADMALVSANRLKAVAGNADLVAKEEVRAAQESEAARIGAYANMAGAAKGFFEEHSTGYKVMQGVEQAFRTWQMAMEIKSMITKLTTTAAGTTAVVAGKSVEMGVMVAAAGVDTATTGVSIGNSIARATASTVAGVAKAFEQLGVWGFVGAAAILAFMASMGGGSTGGGGGPATTTFEDKQKAQGTGTVLGDSTAKSESMAKSLKIMELNSSLELDYQNSMLTALKNIALALGGAAKGILQTNGITGGSAFGTVASSDKAFIGASHTKDITDSGVQFSGTFGQLRGGGGTGKQYEDVYTTSDGGMFRSGWTRTDTNYKALSAEAMKPFSLIFDNMGDLLVDAGSKLGRNSASLTDAINNISVDFEVSLRGLTGQDLTDALNAGISVAFDKVTKQIFPEIAQFQKMGEGIGETLVRVATNFTAVDSVFKSIGKTIDNVYTSAGGMVTRVETMTVAAREMLVELSGGLEAFAQQGKFFLEKFFTETEQRDATKAKLNPVLAQFGLSTEGANAIKMYKDVLLAMNTTTASGAKAYAQLMALAPAFIAVTEAAAGERKSLQNELNELTHTEVELLAQKRAELDPANRQLYDQVQAIKALNLANENLKKAYEDTNKETTDSISNLTTFAQSLRKFTDGLSLGDQSILTPEQKYAEARKQYEETVTAARSGDLIAQGKYTEIASTFLKMSRDVNASGAAYTQDYQKVLQDAGGTETWALQQVDIAKSALEQLTTQTGLLSGIREATLSVAEAIRERDIAQTLVDSFAASDALLAQTPTATSAAIAPAIDYNNYGNAIAAPLVAEIKSLQDQLAKQAEAQTKRDEDLIVGVYESSGESSGVLGALIERVLQKVALKQQNEADANERFN